MFLHATDKCTLLLIIIFAFLKNKTKQKQDSLCRYFCANLQHSPWLKGFLHTHYYIHILYIIFYLYNNFFWVSDVWKLTDSTLFFNLPAHFKYVYKCSNGTKNKITSLTNKQPPIKWQLKTQSGHFRHYFHLSKRAKDTYQTHTLLSGNSFSHDCEREDPTLMF